ncbi:hypothetical protein, partial [Clostridium sp. HV4-5-A1G]
MKNLNLQNLKENSKEILKSEIGALLFNLGKTHIGFWEEKPDKDPDKKSNEKHYVIYFELNKDFKKEFKKEYDYG